MAVRMPKNASNPAFYVGVGKGVLSAFDGIRLLLTSNVLRKVFWQVLKPIRSVQIVYISIAVLLVFLIRDPADDYKELLWTLSRWARVVTIFTTLVLEKYFHANSIIFFAALKEKNPAFGHALEQKERTHTSTHEKFTKFKRVAKLTCFKVMGSVINAVFPASRRIAMPLVKFLSMRSILGDGVSASIAAIDFLPPDVLAASRIDDFLLSFGESIIDGAELGHDATKEFSKRLPNGETRKYFEDRYRGYLTGCGFFYSLLSAIPFLGILMTLVAECGAACVVADIVERNLEKSDRMPLVGEEAIRHSKSS